MFSLEMNHPDSKTEKAENERDVVGSCFSLGNRLVCLFQLYDMLTCTQLVTQKHTTTSEQQIAKLTMQKVNHANIGAGDEKLLNHGHFTSSRIRFTVSPF